jgi:hypothetical protein
MGTSLVMAVQVVMAAQVRRKQVLMEPLVELVYLSHLR